MKGSILAINSGSSSVKFASFDIAPGAPPQRVLHGEVEGIGTTPRLRAWEHEGGAIEERLLDVSTSDHETALGAILTWLGQHASQSQPLAVAHRVVHGGEAFTAPTRVTPDVLAQLARLEPLAPLHQPHNLAAIRAISALQPGLPQIACFDTAFHAGQDWVMQAFALPRRITRLGVKRYGFHGLSYESIASVLPDHLGPAAERRIVVAHLGNGASMCAMRARRSVATSMGFTALDGLMMGTRCVPPRPRRHPLPDGRARHDGPAGRIAAVQGVGAAGRVRTLIRHAHAGGQPASGCAGSDRPLCQLHRARAWRAGGNTGRT
jgi:acetate kinase